MKITDYKRRFAFSITTYFVIPLFLILDIIFSIIMIVEGKNIVKNILLVNITLLICTIVAFFILLLVGLILFKKQQLTQDEHFFYQNRLKLEKSNVKVIQICKIFMIYCLNFVPQKKKKSNNLIFYFQTRREMINFIIKNNLKDYLSIRVKISLSLILNSRKYGENSNMISKKDYCACPCCGNLTFKTPPGGTYFICPICLWEDDDVSLSSPDKVFDINKVSLNKAKENYIEFRACNKEMVDYARLPFEDEINEKTIIPKSQLYWNKLWEDYSQGTLERKYALLCDYYSGINGEGHHGFFDNNAADLEEYDKNLKEILPEGFYHHFFQAYMAYTKNDKVKDECLEADSYFYEKEVELINLIQSIADTKYR